MLYFNYNGKILPGNTSIIGPNNRGLRYGDGLFETMKFTRNELILPDEHFARLWKGMHLLQFDIPRLFSPELLNTQIHDLVVKNKLTSARIRLTVFRGDGGLFDTQNNAPQYCVQAWPLENTKAELNQNGMQLCIYDEAVISLDAFSNLKHNNFLPYLMGAIYAKKQQCNDAVIMNSRSNICETTVANIFVIKDGTFFTPPLTEGCVAGVIRKLILQSHHKNLAFTECPITKEFLMDADEVFLTNSIYNIRWVAAINNKVYTHKIITGFYHTLCETNPGVFC